MKTQQQPQANTLMKTWKASDQTNAEYLGPLEIENNGEYHVFEIMLIPQDRYLFGGVCNTGFLESGYMLLESEENELGELCEQLETYYVEGPKYATRLVCNERM